MNKPGTKLRFHKGFAFARNLKVIFLSVCQKNPVIVGTLNRSDGNVNRVSRRAFEMQTIQAQRQFTVASAPKFLVPRSKSHRRVLQYRID